MVLVCGDPSSFLLLLKKFASARKSPLPGSPPLIEYNADLYCCKCIAFFLKVTVLVHRCKAPGKALQKMRDKITSTVLLVIESYFSTTVFQKLPEARRSFFMCTGRCTHGYVCTTHVYGT